MTQFWSVHTHSRESAGDALPSITRMVAKAKELEYPALALTDHGTMSGAVEFYLACKKAGIKPLIGVEAYMAIDRLAGKRPDVAHMGIVAYTETGYRNLCRLTTLANENFRWKPMLDMGDLAAASARGELDGLIVTTGCWFGLLTKLLRTGDMGSAINVIAALRTWFNGRVYVEIQNHMVDDETHNDVDHCRLLHVFAEVHDLPTVLGQDSHYLEAEDQEVHDIFKTLTSWSDDPDDAIFPGDGYHMVDTAWMEDHHAPDIFDRGMRGLAQIEAMADLVIPELETYHLKVPDTTVSGDPDAELQAAVINELEKLFKELPKSKHRMYNARLTEELDVITTSGFAGYLMLVASVTDWLDEQSIVFRVRGSATGSLVCWLLGITGYDPIKWGLSFDRFLSRDRSKPPDIDLDIEHEARADLLEWLGTKFYVTHIGTAMQYRIMSKTNDPDDDDSKGSLVVALRQRQRKLGEDPDAPISDYWLRSLRKIAGYNGIRKDGTFIDPPIKSFGKHPAGMLIAPDAQTMALVPKRWVASSKTMTSTYDMDSVEKLGLVKLDVLGLRTLTAMRIAEDRDGVHAEDFPLNDRATYQLISSGKTTGMFQLEGWTSAKGVRRMRPRNIDDVIAAMALFRPAAAASGATESYLSRRTGGEEIPARHEIITRHTADTYGVLVYQEQALSILKDLGLSVEEIEKARKAIKASNANVGDAARTLESLMTHIESLAGEKGMTAADVEWLVNAIQAYAGYSFNRAHATAYGILAYQTAYMIVHHPVAFWTGMLAAYEDAPAPYPDAPKPEVTYLAAARERGIRIRAAHVNRSEMTYTTDGTDIFKGITSIPNVGQIAAEELVSKAPFRSLDDLARRCAPGKVTGVKDLLRGHSPTACPGVVKALAESHALNGLKWEASSNLTDKAVRNTTISVANQMIKDVTGQRASRKELGELYDASVKTGDYDGKSKPVINQMLADTYLLAVEVTA